MTIDKFISEDESRKIAIEIREKLEPAGCEHSHDKTYCKQGCCGLTKLEKYNKIIDFLRKEDIDNFKKMVVVHEYELLDKAKNDLRAKMKQILNDIGEL